MFKKSRSVNIICITLAILVLILSGIVGVVWIMAPDDIEEDDGYYYGGLNFGDPSLELYKLTSENYTGAVYLKSNSLGNYDGKKWSESVPEYDKLIDGKYSAAYLTGFALANSGAKEYNFTINISSGNYVLPTYMSVNDTQNVQKSDCKISGTSLVSYNASMYLFKGTKDLSHTKEHAEYEEEYSEFVKENYLYVDPETREYMNEVIRRNGFSSENETIINDVIEYVRGVSNYDLQYDKKLDKASNPILSFMKGEYESGVCRHFAGAATLLYRSIGIPARYTVGYLAGAIAGNTTSVIALNSHAWVEVYIDGIGWIQVEPTPPKSLPDEPDIPEPTVESLGLFKVESTKTEKLYLKVKSYCDLNGVTFIENTEYEDLAPSGYSAQYLGGQILSSGNSNGEYYVTVTPNSDKINVLPYYPVGDGSDNHHIQTNDRYVSGMGKDPYTVKCYSYISDLSTLSPTNEWSRYEQNYKKYVYDNYLSIDSSALRRLNSIVAEQGFKKDSVIVIDKICDYLIQNYTLSNELGNAVKESGNLVLGFTDNGGGSAEQFVGMAVMICRAVGIPARYTEGYKINVVADNQAVVNPQNYYCYMEIYKDGFGWKYEDVFESRKIPTELETVVFTVTTKNSYDKLYLKEKSFGDYNGRGFDEVYNFFGETYNDCNAQYMTSLIYSQNYYRSNDTLSLKKVESDYSIPYLLPYGVDVNEVKGSYNDAVSEGPSNASYIIDFYGSTSGFSDRITNSGLLEFESRYRQYVKDVYLTIDSETLEYMNKIIEQNAFKLNDKYIVERVANYIRHQGKYNLEYNAELDARSNVVIAFLDEYQEGVCRHYAMAATMLYRALGIPARYTEGFAVKTKANTEVSVVNGDAHAWVEIYVDGYGWKCIEVTSGSSDMDIPEPSRENDLSFEFKSLKMQYDGSALLPTKEGMKVKGLKDGHTVEFEFNCERTQPGVSNITIDEDSLCVLDANGIDVTGDYKIKSVSGTLKVYIDTINIRFNDLNFVYDGEEHTGDECTYITSSTNGYFDSGTNEVYFNGEVHTLKVEFKVASRNVCNTVNDCSVTMVDENGNNVSSLYEFNINKGRFVISQKSVTINVGNYSVSVDDFYDSGDEKIIYHELDGFVRDGDGNFIPTGSILADGHYIDKELQFDENSELYGFGQTENKIDISTLKIKDRDGNDVTSNYKIRVVEGNIDCYFPD